MLSRFQRNIALVVLAGRLLHGFSRPAESITESKIKCAYIYNFAKFVKWSPQSFSDEQSPLVICIEEGNPIAPTLQETVAGKTVNERPIVMKTIALTKGVKGCHVLFLSPEEASNIRQFPPQLFNGILTIGDSVDNSRSRGEAVITFVPDNGRIRFVINDRAADKAGLSISSKLLSLAQAVKH